MDGSVGDADQLGFAHEDVSAAIKESIESVLQHERDWCEAKVPVWTAACLEACLKRLAALQLPYKWVATCILMQKTGAGLHTAASCFWDGAVDGSRTVRWEGKTIVAVATVFGLALS